MKFRDTDPSQHRDKLKKSPRRYGRGALVAAWSAGVVGTVAGNLIDNPPTREKVVPQENKIEIQVESPFSNTNSQGHQFTDQHTITLREDGKGGVIAKNKAGIPVELDLHIPAEEK